MEMNVLYREFTPHSRLLTFVSNIIFLILIFGKKRNV